MFKRKTIEELWTEFKNQIIPADSPDIQFKEMRKAFIAGFSTMMLINRRIGQIDISKHVGCEYLEQLYQEMIKEYNGKVN